MKQHRRPYGQPVEIARERTEQIRENLDMLSFEESEMQDGDRTKEQLIAELHERLAELEKDEAERKRAGIALRRNQAMLARTESIAHIGSWEWDVATDTVTWSDELFRIFQRNPTDGAPSFEKHPELYYPEDMQRLKVAVDAAVSNGTPYEMELRAIRKDGETRVCLARGHAEMGSGKSASECVNDFETPIAII
jgi:PAS domain-containing protein